LILAQIER